MEEKDIDPKTIRTYESDVANAIQHRQTSQVDMVLAAAQKKRQTENVVIVHGNEAPEDKTKLRRNILMSVASILILAAGVGVVYYFYTISPLSVKQPLNPGSSLVGAAATSIITPDKQKVLDITDFNTGAILSQSQKLVQLNPLPDNAILEIVLAAQGSTTQNGKITMALTRLTSEQFISAMGIDPPNALMSTLNNKWMFGFYSSTNDGGITTSAPFIILTENFFQNAFAGMLKWEPTMPADLSGLFNFQPVQWAGGTFKDKLVRNKDAREFYDTNGNTLFLYSFVNNNTLVMAQNEDALAEIISRFESKAYVR